VRADAITISVPPGLDEGALLTVPGEGHAGRRAGPPGDLRLTIHVLPHAVFTRDGHDLAIDVPIAIHEAALGARIEVPGLDGPIRLRVPPGTQSGRTFRLNERGLPSARNGGRGDQVVTVHIVLPSVLDERSKALLEEFGRLHPEDVRKPRGA
jgi:molecular chaperone DnaJ